MGSEMCIRDSYSYDIPRAFVIDDETVVSIYTVLCEYSKRKTGAVVVDRLVVLAHKDKASKLGRGGHRNNMMQITALFGNQTGQFRRRKLWATRK